MDVILHGLSFWILVWLRSLCSYGHIYIYIYIYIWKVSLVWYYQQTNFCHNFAKSRSELSSLMVIVRPFSSSGTPCYSNYIKFVGMLTDGTWYMLKSVASDSQMRSKKGSFEGTYLLYRSKYRILTFQHHQHKWSLYISLLVFPLDSHSGPHMFVLDTYFDPDNAMYRWVSWIIEEA